MFKKYISTVLALAFVLAMAIPIGAIDLDHSYDMILSDVDEFFDSININELCFIEPDEQILSTATIDDDFEDNSVVIILTRAASRDNRDFTADDFSNVGAVYVEDVMRLTGELYEYGQALWAAEHRMNAMEYAMSTENSNAMRNHIISDVTYAAYKVAARQYEVARQEAEENTLVKFDVYRRMLLVRLEENCKENVLNVVHQLQQRDYIRYAGPNY